MSGIMQPIPALEYSGQPPGWQPLLQQLQQLVDEQFQQFDQILDHYDALLAGTDGVAEGWEDLKQRRTDWEARCQSVSQDMDEEYKQLAEAWEHLEQQQRVVESTAGTPPGSRGAPATGTFLTPAGGMPASGTGPEPDLISRPGGPVPAKESLPRNLDIRDAWTPQLNEAATLQFQQMRRQIQSHAAENRRK